MSITNQTPAVDRPPKLTRAEVQASIALADAADGADVRQFLDSIEAAAERYRETCPICGSCHYPTRSRRDPKRRVTCGRPACIGALVARTKSGKPDLAVAA